MKQHTEELDLRTEQHSEMINITEQVQSAVKNSGIREGLLVVHVPHTTAGVTVNENADPDVVHDMLAALELAVPWRQPFYKHNEENSAAHVKSTLVGCSQTLLISNAKLMLGTWQGVYFCEFDGPRSRSVIIRAFGE